MNARRPRSRAQGGALGGCAAWTSAVDGWRVAPTSLARHVSLEANIEPGSEKRTEALSRLPDHPLVLLRGVPRQVHRYRHGTPALVTDDSEIGVRHPDIALARVRLPAPLGVVPLAETARSVWPAVALPAAPGGLTRL